MFLILYITTLLFAQDVIKYPETLPVNNPELVERFKQKEQPQLLDDDYWDDDRILFSTYFGGSGYDCINDGAFDSQGNFIQVGYTGSPDLPIVGDAFQKEKNLNHDMFIVKWNPGGDVIWSTFLGGSGADVLYSVAIDKNDDIIVAGRTESFDIKVSDDASQINNLGNSDFYLAKFTTDGQYVWSTFWGGSLQEYQPKIVLDENDFIYMGGVTGSTGREDKPNKLLPTRDNALYKEIIKYDDEGTYVTTYLSKFTPDGKYVWGTYFGNNGSVSDVITGIDVFEDEIAFSWDISEVREINGEKLFIIVTEDAEQKEGVIREGNWRSEGWQTQVFKIDTAGTTLKYGTFYTGDNSLSKKVKYDKDGNLILHVGALRDKARKDSVFESTGHLVFVKYNRKNELEWDFGFGCFDEGLTTYDFDIDENNVLWTAGRTTCDDIEVSIKPFPTIIHEIEGVTDFMFILNLNNYKHWFSYFDINLHYCYNVSVRNNILNLSGTTDVMRTREGIFRNGSFVGPIVSFDMKNVLNYEDSSGIQDTTVSIDNILIYPNPVNDYIYLNEINLIKSIKIIDLVGKEYLNLTYIKNEEINVTYLSAGVYFIIINEEKVFKIIKR